MPENAVTPETEIALRLREMVARRGAALYGDEAVSQEQHALQCARMAEQEDAPPWLVVAALLHDIGHLLEADYGTGRARERDARHEVLGEDFLATWFGPEVTEPVRLHVAAKRYLCAVDAPYFDTLSPASKHSLMLQGGPMSDAEVAAFEREPFHTEAVRLRRWDDRAKDPEMTTPDLEHFLPAVVRCVKASEA